MQGEQPNNVVRELSDLLDNFSKVMKTLVFNDARALAEVNADYSTTTELADTLQRVAEVPFRVGHHFASEVVNYGRGNNLKPAEIPYAEAQKIYAEAAKHYKLEDTKLPLTEAQFRTSLSPQNMVEASQGLGGPQPAEVARMLSAEKDRVAKDRAWMAASQAKLAEASRKLDETFAQVRAGK